MGNAEKTEKCACLLLTLLSIITYEEPKDLLTKGIKLQVTEDLTWDMVIILILHIYFYIRCTFNSYLLLSLFSARWRYTYWRNVTAKNYDLHILHQNLGIILHYNISPWYSNIKIPVLFCSLNTTYADIALTCFIE